MGAYTTSTADLDTLQNIVRTLKSGYKSADGKTHRPSAKLAAIVTLEANTGIRIGDLLRLRPCDFVREGNFWRFNITEQKTGKVRAFPVPDAVYRFVWDYCQINQIQTDARIFPITPREVQKQLKAVREYLGYDNISTHSFRKFAGQEVYEASGYDIEAAREFYQHASVHTTQVYLRRTSRKLESAIEKSVHII